jgi:hypothetical protein
MERGKYFRIATDVIVDGESLLNILIEAGMVIKYNGVKKHINGVINESTIHILILTRLFVY